MTNYLYNSKLTVITLLFLLLLVSGCKKELTFTINFKSNGKIYPADQVTISLYGAKDINGNSKFTTDKDGKFTATFNEKHNYITASIYLENSNFSYRKNGCDTEHTPVARENLYIDYNKSYHDITLTFDVPEGELWHYLQRAAGAFDFSKTTFKPKLIPICPGDANLFRPKTGWITIKLNRDFLRDVISHEYGHALMFWAVGYDISSKDCQTHKIKEISNPYCAWIEGWANFYSVYSRYYYDHKITPTFRGDDLEDYFSPIIGKDGFKDEGRVAAGLWDLFDTPNDCNHTGKPTHGDKTLCDHNGDNTISVEWMINMMQFLPKESVRTFYKKLRSTFNNGHMEKDGDEIMGYNYLIIN